MKLLGHLVGAVLGAGEHEERALFLAQHVFQQAELAFLFHFIEPEVDILNGPRDGTDTDADRILQVLVHQVRHRGLDGRRKEYGLAIGTNGREQAVDGGQEAHVEHTVGFIEHHRGWPW